MPGGSQGRLLVLMLPAVALGVATAGGLLILASAPPGAGAGLALLSTTAPSAADASGAASVPLSLVLFGGALIVAIAFTAGYFIIPRGGVDEVFLVHESGLLLVHFSKTLRPAKDRDVLVGMLTAVQTFVRDAFSKGPTTDLREMDFGDRKLLICKGTYGYLAVVIQGRTPLGMARRMRTALGEVEAKFRPAIASWDGSAEALSGADDVLIASLLTGRIGHVLRTFVAALRTARARLVAPRPLRPAASASARAKGIRTDPSESARALLRRPELQSLRPEYRDMMSTALHQIEEGRFSLTGLANLYMVMALQKSPRPNIVGWWNLVLRTVREVLWSWTWTPPAQAWVLDEDAIGTSMPPEAAIVPLEAPREVPEPSGPGLSGPAVGVVARSAPRSEPADSP